MGVEDGPTSLKRADGWWTSWTMPSSWCRRWFERAAPERSAARWSSKLSGERILALDLGERRIGVAVSDPTGLLATPLKAIDRTQSPSVVSEIIRLVEEYEACEIVVGLPVSLTGRLGTQVQRTRRFVDSLADQTSVPVILRDERYTSVQAERLLREAGQQPSRDKGRVDSAAAALILQSHLDSRRPGSG